MEKSNGIKIGMIVATLSLLFCSPVIIQISYAEDIELKSVGKEMYPVKAVKKSKT